MGGLGLFARRRAIQASPTQGNSVRIADAEVLRILLANGVASNGESISKEDAKRLQSIGTWFSGNSLIETFVELNAFANVTTLDASAFKDCGALYDIGLDNIATIASESFSGCTALTKEIVAPKLSGTLGERAFRDSSITSFKAPNLSIVSPTNDRFGYGSFYNCAFLRNVEIPSATYIGIQAFYGCTALEEVKMESVVTIMREAFSNCTLLRGDMILPRLAGSLGPKAFFKCQITAFDAPNLTKLPEADFELYGYGAFQYCTALQRVSIPSVTFVGTQAFYGCSSLSIVELRDVITLRTECFAACTALQSIIIQRNTPPTIENKVFNNTNSTFVIYVPDEAVSTYKAASGWSSYASRIKGISEYQG